jgi:hypothetical protein
MNKPQEYFIKNKDGQVMGHVLIDDKEREVNIVTDGAWTIPLSKFSEVNSGIQWSWISIFIYGYTLVLRGISIDDDNDRKCLNWFKDKGCKI